MRSSEVSRTRGLIVDVPSLDSDDIRVAVAVHRFVPVMPVSILASLRDTSSLHPRIRLTAAVGLRTKACVSFKDVLDSNLVFSCLDRHTKSSSALLKK